MMGNRGGRPRALWLLVLVLAGFATAGAAQPVSLERGAYLVTVVGACGNCHTPKGPAGDLPGKTLAGGMVFDEQPFRAVAPNITQDRATGIGNWTDAQIATAIREGRRPDGTIIGPPMPVALYRGIADADIAAMVAYLRTVPAVDNRVEASRYRMPLPPNYGPPLGVVPGPADDPVSRGAYLAGPLAHCIECHTPRLADGRLDLALVGAGGMTFTGPWGTSVAANLRPVAMRGVTDEQILRAIMQGISPEGRRLLPPMGYAYYAGLSPRDQADILAWIRSLPPR